MSLGNTDVDIRYKTATFSETATPGAQVHWSAALVATMQRRAISPRSSKPPALVRQPTIRSSDDLKSVSEATGTLAIAATVIAGVALESLAMFDGELNGSFAANAHVLCLSGAAALSTFTVAFTLLECCMLSTIARSAPNPRAAIPSLLVDSRAFPQTTPRRPRERCAPSMPATFRRQLSKLRRQSARSTTCATLREMHFGAALC